MHIQSVFIDSQTFPKVDNYPFNLVNLKNTPELNHSNPVTIYVGENGSGKSTLLAAIARKANIHIWNDEAISPLRRNPYTKTLHHFIRLKWSDGQVNGAFFSAQNFRRFAELVEEWAKDAVEVLDYYGGDSMINKSHGQTNMQFFKACFQRRGLYLLDEPEAALSPKTQLELVDIICEASQHH
jgi:predicted ATPase